MSGNSPSWSYTPVGPITVARGNSVSINFMLEDLNSNPFPSGSDVSFTISGTGLSLGTPSSFEVPCTTEPTNHPITITASTTATSGSLIVTTETPSGVSVVSSYPVTVTP
jgi:hypothetical protein